jgi:hypothetical protein
LSNFGPAVPPNSEGTELGPPETVTGEILPQYLDAIHHPDDYDPSVEDEAMGRDIDVLNEEMIAVYRFSVNETGGLAR